MFTDIHSAMAYSDDEKQAAINFAEVFCNLLDNHRDQFAAYLADDAVLDWFGQRISSKVSVASFMKSGVPETVHNLKLVEPSRPIEDWKKTLVESVDNENNVVTSEGQKLHEDSLSNKGLVKPLGNSGYMVQAGCSKEVELKSKLNLNSMPLERSRIEKYKSFEPFQPQFGTAVNCEIPVAPQQYSSARYEDDQGDPKTRVKAFTKVIQFIEALGNVQFRRTKCPNTAAENMKKVADPVKWNRFCKLQIAYSTPNTVFHSRLHDDGIAGNFEIFLLVYRDMSRCRVNLTKVFDRIK
jgi:hypothetical protein